MSESFPEKPKGYKGKHGRLEPRFSSHGYKQHAKGADELFLTLPSPGDRELVTEKRSYAELLTHDGTKTYLVHSTTPEQAQDILKNGLHVLGTKDNVNLEHTVVLMAGPNDKDQAAKNAFNLAYQYDGGNAGGVSRTAKLIIEIPKPTPDVEIGRDSFQGTYLQQADGENIVNLGDAPHPEYMNDTLYVIPPARVMGYIDLGSNELDWNPNPNFEPQASEQVATTLGKTAIFN